LEFRLYFEKEGKPESLQETPGAIERNEQTQHTKTYGTSISII
jgi:hypothetical protein